MELKLSAFAPLCCVILAGCSESQVTKPATTVLPQQIIGSWKLKTVDNASPSIINIKSYHAEFLKDGKWKFSCEMGGQYKGIQMNGSGTWKIVGSSLHCKAGTNQQQSELSLENQTLKLAPDPVILRDGKTPVTTIYEK